MVSSQLTVHPRTSAENRIKAWIHLANILDALGIDTLTTDVNHHLADEALDHLLRLNPVPDGEAFDSPVCRRIFAFYGPSYRHAQLAPATHDAIPTMFGVTSVGAFEHISAIMRKGYAVDARGDDVYLPHVDRLALPMLLLAGAENQIFVPETSLLTYEWLRANNDRSLYRRWVIDQYGHMDCFVGRDAATDVFPTILDHLEAT